MDDHVSFDDKEAKSNPYPGPAISLSIVEFTIPKVLADTESAFNILYVSMLKWMGIPSHFLQSYSNMVLELNGALTRAKRPNQVYS